MSKNNAKMVQQKMSDQRQKFGIRKLSVGVASVLLGTVFYMQGGAVHADVNPTVSADDNSVNVVAENSGINSLAVGLGTSSSAGSANSASPVVSASDVTNSIATSQTSSSSVGSAAGQVSNAASAVSDQGSVTPASQVNVGVDKIVKNENTTVDSESTQVPNSQIAPEKSVAGSGSLDLSGVTPFQSVLATPAETEVPVANLAVDSKVNIAYTANDQSIKINYVDSDTNDPVDLTKWTYDVDNLGNAHVLSYNGDITQPIYIPNSYDFIQAGKITAEHKAFITSDNMQKLAGSGTHELYISKNGNGKVIAEDSDWHGTFCGDRITSDRNKQLSEKIGKNLEKLDLTNLDVTNIKNMEAMFYGASNLTSIGGLSNWNTHNVTNMSDMFSGTSELTNIDDLSNWDTSNVTDMNGMFSCALKLTNISGLSNWDTSKVTDMSSMFKWSSELTNIGNLSSWNTSNVTNMSNMFDSEYNLTNIGDLSNWDTSKVTDMSYMFSGASKLTNIGNLSNWDTGKVTYMNDMFKWNRQLTNIGDLSSWNTSNVTDMSNMFNGASSLTNIGNLSNWDTHNVTNMSTMFNRASSLTNIGDLSNWDTSKVTDMSYMFSGASKLTNIGDLSNWDTHNVTNMNSMFLEASSLTNIGNLSNWDTSKVTDMSSMFSGTSKLTNIGDLSNWDTSKVTDMSSMFYKASNLTNIGNLSNWDTSKVTKMALMFGATLKLTNIGDLSNWDTRNVTSMSSMFSDISSLTNIGDLSNWDTHNVTNMSSMFQGASSLTNIGDLSNWDTSKVTYMSYMFYGASKLTNIGDLSNWDTSKVTYMMYMFSGASSLTNIGDLSNWDTSKVTYMNDMFSEASSLTNIGDLSNWDTHNVTNMSSMFYRTFNLTNVGDLSKWNVNNVVNSQKMMQSFGKDSKEPILQKLPSFTKTKNSSSELPIASTGTGVYDARGITSDVQRTSADDYWNNHIVLTSDTSLLDHSNISNNVNSKINQITINGNKIALPVFYKDYQDLHDTVQKAIDNYAEKLRSQGKIVKSTPKVADYSTEPTTDWLKYFTNYTIDVVNQTKINYVDTDGTTIHTTVIEGKSGETVSVPNEIPTGYKLVAGLSVPTEITFTADGYPITNLAIEAIHTTVTADNPKTTADKLPDNPTKNYPEGVAESDLNKTVTRIINITDPRTQKVTPVVQTVHLTRSADVDEITGEVVYSDWTTSSFDSYNVPEVPGYTASQTSVAKETVTSDTKGQTVNITYTANDHQISVKYVDDDQGEKVVGTGTVSGKTGAAVTITPSLPSGYMLTPGKDTPSTYTVTAGDNQVVTIHLQKQFVDTSATDPQAKQTRTVTLHYVYGAGDKQGQKAFDDAVLNVYYHRTATLDRATNKTTYGDWLWDQSQGDPSTPGYHVVSGKWANLPQHWANVIADVPSIKGYHTDLGQNDPANTNHVPANIWVYPTWNGAGSAGETLDNHESKAYQTSARLYEVQPEHTVRYMPNKTTLTVKYIDDDNKGAVVGSQHWDGTTGQHINLTLTPPDNYVLSPGWVNPTNYDFDGVNNAWYNVHVKHAVQTQIVTSQLTIHYVNSEDHQQELKAPTVITRQYTRTNVSHNDGTTQYGDWSYVPGSFKQTGTSITVNDSDNPVKQDNVYNADENENMDGFTVIARYPTIEDYTMHDGIGGVRSTDWLGNSDRQAATLTDNIYAEYDEHKERSIAVKFVDDQSDGQQVGQATTVTGRDGDTVDLKLTVPDKYQLADGQQLPTSYTFTKGSGDLEIHLTHKVVQREATINVKLSSDTLVRIKDNHDNHDGVIEVIPQTYWAQLDDKIKKSPDLMHYLLPSVAVGTLTGHVNYDLVDEGIVSFGNDWTTLNLGGQTYQMPDGDDVVNGVVFDFSDGTSEKFVEEYLKWYPNTDPDYVNRSWHSYLSANATKNFLSHESGPMLGSVLQAGLVGNKQNTLAKATGDHAATSVEMGDTTIDLSLLQSFDFETRDFSEQNGQLRADGFVPVVGVYIPYIEKTVTRTINVVTPDGKTATVKQTATLAKQIDFADDDHPAWTTGEWTNYDVPVIPGYTASQSQVAKETVTGETKDQTVNITYTANPQTTTVVYQTEDGTPVYTSTVNGHTGQTVKVSNEVPAGWHIVNGNVPSEITFGPDGAPKTVVTIDHSHVTVTPDAPKTTTDHLPDNPGKTYPAGVSHDDLNKTVTGTIKVTMPDGQVKTVVKTAKLTRTADVDEVTGDVKYSDWTTGYWSDYTAPVVPGYTANYPYIAGQAVTGMTQDQTIEINYTANDQSTHINYVDTQGKTIHTTTVNGKTNQTVDVPNEVPTGWKLVDGQTVPSTITFGPDGHADTSVKIEHRYVMVTPDKPQTNGIKLPENPAQSFHGVEASDLNKTATRTIKVTTPDGQTKTVTQTVKLTRMADVDEVTGDVSYGKWTTGQWAKYDVPVVNGYTATQTEVAAVSVNEHTTDQTVNVSYTPNKQTTTVKYVDDKGEVVHVTAVNGVTNQTIKVPSEVPTGWMITKGQVPSEVTFGANGHKPIEVTVAHHHVTVDSDHPQTNGTKLPNNPAKTFNGVEANDLNKTITRTIKVTAPDGQTKIVTQTVKLTRTADVDEVTGEVTYGNWTTGQWDAYEVPTVPGYTASQTTVAATPVDGITKDQTITISYTANSQTTHINYVDESGKTVHTTTVTGKTGETVKVPNELPTGWMITKGQVPSEISFGPNSHTDETITISHRHVTVDSDHPQTNGTKLPDNPAKTFNGVEENDLNKTITRTIKVTTPDGKTTTTKQTTKLTRTATVDEVTGDVTYSNWSTGQWAKYDVPAVNGYTSTQTEVAAVSVNEHTADQTVNVSYTPNKQTTTVKYVDDKGEVVHTTTVDGVTNQTVKVPSEVPTGWTITKGQVPSEVIFGANGHESIEITIAHHHVTVDPDHPQTNGTKLPDNPAKTFNGVEANDLNKTIARTIKVTTPDGQTKTVTQTAKLTRSASVDEVTGEVTYGDWTTGEWAAYDVPSVAGYTPSQAKVAKETVTAASKDTTTVITYTPNQHQISVEYVDDDAHGKVVKIDQVPGKTDQTITVTPSAPANYDLVDNGNRTYTVTSGDGQRVQIHVKHHQVTTSESKAVTRTINVHTLRNGVKTVKQTADLNRNVTTDQVTGDKTYGDWTTGQWEAYTPDAIPGYTLSTSEVSSANIDGSSTDQTVDVTYIANTQHVDIVYVDDAKGGAVVKTDQVVGKTDETVKVTPNVPTGYKVVGEVPGSYTMTADGRQTITVHLVHQTKTASESKAVTRTINVHTPHDGTTVFKQTVDLSRDVTTDQVTGDKTYGDWSATEWTHYDVPAVDGYTPSIKQVAQQVVDGTTKDQTVNVTYTANDQTTHINYVDGDGNVVHSTTITGKTDQTVKVPNETLAGWKVVDESVPTEITFGPDGHADVAVTVDHQHVTVTPDDPKTPADKLPNNPGKTYPDGVGHSDLNRTVTRTIKVTTPDRQTKTVTQIAKLTRTADIDEVTGKVTYGKWTTGEWSRYEVPSVPGYTASQSEVPAVNVTDTTKDQMLTLTYTANDQTTHVNYVDGNGKSVHMTTITGKTDQTVKVPNEVPTGWTITDGQVPAEIPFGPDGHDDVTVTVGHQHVTVTPDQPKTPSDKLLNNPGKTYPSGVGHDDLNKTITRTVKVTTPDGKTQTTEQKVQLTRIADVDEVTGEVTYGKWTTGEWSSYKVSAVPGYTASQSNVPATKVTSDTKNQTVTVTYMANAQITTINYVDQTGKTVHTTVVNGHTDQTVNVPNETPAGWTITKGQVPTEITFGSNGHDYVTVTVDHKHVSVTPDKPQTDGTKLPDNPSQTFHGVGRDDLNKTITRTIEVTVPTGKTDTIKQTAKLTRTASVDEVTGAVTYGDWTTAEWSAFIVPSLPGYTPSQKTISSITVKSDDKDVEETVIYSPNKQVMTINYIDDVTGKTLSTKQLIGVSDASSNYNTKSSIDSYVADHYKLVSDDTNSDNLVFDHDDSTDQVYNVHLTHTYQKVDDHKVVNETVHYVYDNGQTARPDYKAPVINFSRTGTKDLVTSNIVWNAWTLAEQSFDQVTTPAINGYTPDFEVVPSVNVNHGSADVERTVIYHADDQTILVNYIDDDTHSTLKTDTVIGKTAQKSNYTTKKSIDGYVADYYELVNDDTNDSELVFDSDSTKAQVYNVHFKHVHQNVSDSALVNETIHYIYADGSTARDDYQAPVINFKRTGDKDLVTNAVVWNAWTPASQDFKAVDSPVIAGYTPSQKTISSITVKSGDKDIDQTVIYVPDTQSIVVNYVDDVTGKTLKTDTLTGKSDLVSDYTTKNNITGYENQHYVLVSDDTQGKTLTFDHDDKAAQVYNVHLNHQTEPATQSRTVNETINYVYADGSKAADTVTAEPLTFTQAGVKDLVNGNIDWNGTWTAAQVFGEVKSTEIIGYTASRKVVDPITVDHNSSDIHQTVIYVANNQTAKIKYVDDVTGKTLETDSANGKFGDQIDFGHDVDTQIKAFEGQGYKFKSNSFNGQKYQADNSQNEFEVYFTHGKQNVSRTDKVTETVKYQFVDGRQAQKDHVQTVEFTQHGVQDLVTKTTVWTPSDPQTFVSVDTPYISGYTADVQNVPVFKVDFGDADITKVVTYKANDQLAGIKYIDDTTGKTLDIEAASGKFGIKIEFMHDPSSMIQKFEGQGYKLVSNSFKDQDYQADNSKNYFEVHFKHGMKDVSRTSTITRTIKYVDQNIGKEVHQPVIQTLTFTENGVTDLVTGKTTWDTPSDQQFVKVESPKIDGYEHPDILVVDAKTAKFGDSDQTVTVRYQKVETPSNPDTLKEPNDSSTPSMTSTQNESNISTMSMHTPTQVGSQNASDQQIVNNHGESQLPQTGNQNSHQSGLVGLMSLTLAGLLGFVKRRKKND